MNSFELEVVGRDGMELKNFNVLKLSGLSFRTIAVVLLFLFRTSLATVCFLVVSWPFTNSATFYLGF